MKVIVISVYPFPIGFSATNRIISYSKGLVELGHSVKYYCLRPTEHREGIINHEFKGTYEGIEYEYTGGTSIWSKYGIIKVFQALYGYIMSFYILLDAKFKRTFDYAIISSDNVYIIFLISIYISKILKKKTVLIVDEFPHVLRQNVKIYGYLPSLLKIEQRVGYRFFDGIITMTNALSEYFTVYKKKITKMKVIPMTVEPDRFDIKLNNIDKEKYIAYIGDLVKDKDGVDKAISAFAIICNKYSDYKFYIIGAAKCKKDFDDLSELVTEYNLENKVVFKGKVQRNEVPDYLCRASLLVLARPNNERAAGGFPTKLGEYLATGNPVVVTDVGEISHYLEDGINAYISSNNEPKVFAQKIDEALSNPVRSREIGLKGKELAYSVFNYKTQARNIAEFLNSL